MGAKRKAFKHNLKEGSMIIISAALAFQFFSKACSKISLRFTLKDRHTDILRLRWLLKCEQQSK